MGRKENLSDDLRPNRERPELTPRSPRPDSNVTSKSRTNPSRRYWNSGSPVSPARHHALSVLPAIPHDFAADADESPPGADDLPCLKWLRSDGEPLFSLGGCTATATLFRPSICVCITGFVPIYSECDFLLVSRFYFLQVSIVFHLTMEDGISVVSNLACFCSVKYGQTDGNSTFPLSGYMNLTVWEEFIVSMSSSGSL